MFYQPSSFLARRIERFRETLRCRGCVFPSSQESPSGTRNARIKIVRSKFWLLVYHDLRVYNTSEHCSSGSPCPGLRNLTSDQYIASMACLPIVACMPTMGCLPCPVGHQNPRWPCLPTKTHDGHQSHSILVRGQWPVCLPCFASLTQLAILAPRFHPAVHL